MVRKSVLVYDLLRTQQPQNGFSEREIVDQISNKHNIAPGKGLRRQVAVALRRGVDFGILAKKNNKFRFDPDGAKASATSRRGSSSRPSRGRKKSTGKRTTRTKQKPKDSKSKERKQTRPGPSPKMPKTWTPSRRNLPDEPASKVKKI